MTMSTAPHHPQDLHVVLQQVPDEPDRRPEGDEDDRETQDEGQRLLERDPPHLG